MAAEGRLSGRWSKAPTVPTTVGFVAPRGVTPPSPAPLVSAALELDMSTLVDLAAGAMPQNSQKLMLVQVRRPQGTFPLSWDAPLRRFIFQRCSPANTIAIITGQLLTPAQHFMPRYIHGLPRVCR